MKFPKFLQHLPWAALFVLVVIICMCILNVVRPNSLYVMLIILNILNFANACDVTAKSYLRYGLIKLIPTGIIWKPIPYIAAGFVAVLVVPTLAVMRAFSHIKNWRRVRDDTEEPDKSIIGMIKHCYSDSLWVQNIATTVKTNSALMTARKLQDKCIYCGMDMNIDSYHDQHGMVFVDEGIHYCPIGNLYIHKINPAESLK